jgi:predicted acetyltransferase
VNEMDVAREEDLPALSSLLTWAFCSVPEAMEPWLRRVGLENARVIRRGERLGACLLFIPMGQFFGGRSVPMVGIAGVGAPPESRGSGDAIALMRSALRELRAGGVALSALFPATLGLYRRVGYECAGGRYEATVRTSDVGDPVRSLPCREATPDDRSAIEACYRKSASLIDGHVDRGSYVWYRVESPRGADHTRGFVVGQPGQVEGYAYLYERRKPGGYSLHASDFVATTPAAHARLLTLARDHGTLAETFSWNAPAHDPFVQLLPRVGTQIKLDSAWMLRIVDLPAALAARGWPRHVKAAIDLEIEDQLLEENAGRWTLRVSEGRAEIARGGRGDVRLDVRALAPLFSGFASARALAGTGAIRADAEGLDALAAAFPLGAPWMPDFF